jgi:hypothetical protein
MTTGGTDRRLRISPATSRLLIVTVSLFAIVALLQFARSRGILPVATAFAGDAVASAVILVVSIFIALGKYDWIVRLSFALLAATCLFFLCCFDWLAMKGEPWNVFAWLGFISNSTASSLILSLPVALVAVTLPLWLMRLRQPRCTTRETDRLTIGNLFAITACIGATVGLVLAVQPYPRWFVDYARGAFTFLAEPSALAVGVLFPGVYNALVAFLALIFLWRMRRSYFATIGIASASSFVIASSYFLVGRLVVPELTPGWSNVLVLTGETLLTLFLVYVVLVWIEPSLDMFSQSLNPFSAMSSVVEIRSGGA